MVKRFLGWFSALAKGGDGGKKGTRSTLFLLALVCLGIFFMFVSVNPQRDTIEKAPPDSTEVILPVTAKADYRERLEKDLADRLRRIQGVGDVTVLITLESGPVYQYAENTDVTDRSTTETDSAGGQRNTKEVQTRVQTVMTRSGSGEQALVTREIQPKVAGVIVIAKGAQEPLVRERIMRAVEAGLKLPLHRIQVLPMK